MHSGHGCVPIIGLDRPYQLHRVVEDSIARRITGDHVLVPVLSWTEGSVNTPRAQAFPKLIDSHDHRISVDSSSRRRRIMGNWRRSACDLKTGRLLTEPPLAASGSVSRVLCGTSNGTFRLPLTDPATSKEWWQATLPGRTTIVGELDGGTTSAVAWAGIIWTRRLTDTLVVELAADLVGAFRTAA
jgi:hypothetical protein